MKKPKRTFKQNRIFTQNNPLSPRICPELAKEIGLNESILLLQYEFWIATEGEEQDGQLWTRKTVREIKQVFSFWGTSTINRIINKLTDEGYLVAGDFDENERKNGRWVKFGFEKLATLASIKIICAESGQTFVPERDNLCANMEQTVIQSGTNNEPSPYIDKERDQEKRELSPHARLMDHIQLAYGAIANPAKEGRAIKWLLEHYDPLECIRCFDFLAAQEWRTSQVSWVTVESQIGGFLNRENGNGNGHKPTASERRVDQLRANAEFLRSGGRQHHS